MGDLFLLSERQLARISPFFPLPQLAVLALKGLQHRRHIRRHSGPLAIASASATQSNRGSADA